MNNERFDRIVGRAGQDSSPKAEAEAATGGDVIEELSVRSKLETELTGLMAEQKRLEQAVADSGEAATFLDRQELARLAAEIKTKQQQLGALGDHRFAA